MIFHSWYSGNVNRDEYVSQGKHEGELIIGSVKQAPVTIIKIPKTFINS